MVKIKKKSCGLCGATKNLTKTKCCNNFICDDEDKYVLFSFATNSCHRNHRRYTLCSTHYYSNHKGKWQECKKCKDEYSIENYVYFATNDFNFEKLPNAPKITIRCINCEFESNTMEDFAFETSEGFYCTKSKCQKKATAPLSKR